MDIGIRNIVIGYPQLSRDQGGGAEGLAAFYGELLGMRQIRKDWLVIAEDQDRPMRLAFDEPSDDPPPQWPDPEYPQQVHLDIVVADLPTAEELVLGLGATRLQDTGEYRSYADPVGHPFCLYLAAPTEDDDPGRAGRGRIDRVVFDCFSPRSLASFYQELMGMPRRVHDSPHRVVITGQDDGRPMLGFQHVPQYKAPRWPDPRYPQQIHLDLDAPNGEADQRRAEELGAIRLPEMGGSCPIYADPAGHPFCLCSLDQ